MRRVRMLGLCLATVSVMSALVASSAMASKEPLSPKQLEKLYSSFKQCPLEEEKAAECITAETSGGKTGGEYTVGSITIPLKKKILLQGGSKEVYEGEPAFAEAESIYGYPLENAASIWYEAKNGESLVSPPLAVPGGLKNRITPQPYWPKGLTESFESAKKNRELGATETLQLAGRPWLSRENLLEQERTAYHLPMKVVVNSPWLTTLGGGTCHIGSTEHPIEVELTSGISTGPYPYEYNTSRGAKGELKFADNYNEVKIVNSTLVDNTYAVTTGAEGCGGSYESYVDTALDRAAGVPSPAGANSVILSGSLYDANADRDACVFEEYVPGRLTERRM